MKKLSNIHGIEFIKIYQYIYYYKN